MKWAVLAIFVAFTALATWFVWQNRGSGKIIEGVIPATFAVLIGVLLTTGLAKLEPITAVIPATFLTSSTTHLPIFLPDRQGAMAVNFLPSELLQRDPAAFSSGNDAMLYHHLLQAAIIQELATYFQFSWLPTITRVRVGGGVSTTFSGGPKGRKLEKSELDGVLAGSKFAGFHVGGASSLVLPLKTSMTVRLPTDQKGGEVHFEKSGFFDLKIETDYSSGGVGLGGYGSFFRESQGELQKLFWSENYTIKVTATFAGYRSGHPDMPNYRAWANAIVDVLKNGFDEGEAYARTEHSMVLKRQFGK